MFKPSNILYIKNFDFERHGTDTRNKYMVVLLEAGTDAIIAPLTTSVNRIPESHAGKRCVIDEPSRLHCYCMPDALVIGKKVICKPSMKPKT